MQYRHLSEPILGFDDRYGWELRVARNVANRLKDIFESHGYEEIETPIVERQATHWREVKKRKEDMFLLSVDDNAGDEKPPAKIMSNEAVLRPEGTAPVCRFVVNRFLAGEVVLPFRFFYITQMFRNERVEKLLSEDPTKRSLRQFYQAGIELMGCPYPVADAEVIDLAIRSLQILGLHNARARLGNVALFLNLSRKAKLDDATASKVKKIIDEKISLQEAIGEHAKADQARKELLKTLESKGISGQLKDAFVTIADTRGEAQILDDTRRQLGSFEDCVKEVQFLRDVAAHLQALGQTNFMIDLGVVRGLDIYSGNVFQVDVIDEEKDLEVIGGGRYDNLIEETAKSVGIRDLGISKLDASSTGFGIGLERLIDALSKRNILPQVSQNRADLLLFSSNPVKAMNRAKVLREQGNRVEVDILSRTLDELRQVASRLKIPRILDVDRDQMFQV